MKKNFKTIFATMAAMLVVSACSDFDGVLSGNESGDGKMAQGGTPVATEFGITVEEMEGEISTRTTIGSNGKDVLWSTGDQIAVYDTPLSWRAFTLASGAGTATASFNGQAIASDKYYAIYPIATGASKTCTEDGVIEHIAINNCQGSEITDGDNGGTAPIKLMMGVSNSDKNIQFKNVTARIDINLTNVPSDQAHLYIDICSNGGESLVGSGTLSWNDGDPKFTTIEDGYPFIHVPNAQKSSTNRLYAIPGTLASGWTICVQVFGPTPGMYYFHSNNPLTLKRNKVYTFNLDLKKANGIGSVDLGLPSGMLVNAMNIGAKNITESGNYYQWGDKSTKAAGASYNFMTYMHQSGGTEDAPQFIKYVLYRDRTHGTGGNFSDGKGTLDAFDDVAASHSNGEVRMPTADEMQEIIANTTATKVSIGGTNFYKITSKINGNSVILPFTGYRDGTSSYDAYCSLWTSSSSLSTRSNGYKEAANLTIDAEGATYKIEYTRRCIGRNVRGVQYKDKYPYVDMGAAGKWATMNVGANKPEDFGNYYSWAETEEKTNYAWSTYKWGTSSAITKYTTTSSLLTNEDDAVMAEWGSDWAMPTDAQFQALIDACNWTKNMEGAATYSGVEGWIGTLKTDATKKIFLPCAGYKSGTSFFPYIAGSGGAHRIGEYWTRNLKSVVYGSAVYIEPNTTTINAPQLKSETRERGITIRPIHK